jgi:hypothetical protein
MQQAPAYRQAVSEFDRLWESGKSRGHAQRMRELLLVIEAFENASAAPRLAADPITQGAKQ